MALGFGASLVLPLVEPFLSLMVEQFADMTCRGRAGAAQVGGDIDEVTGVDDIHAAGSADAPLVEQFEATQIVQHGTRAWVADEFADEPCAVGIDGLAGRSGRCEQHIDAPPWYDESTDSVWVATSDKILRFSLEPTRWVERVCELVPRELTPDEWERLVPGDTPQRPARN